MQNCFKGLEQNSCSEPLGKLGTPSPLLLIASSECSPSESLLEVNFGWPGELSSRKTDNRLKF